MQWMALSSLRDRFLFYVELTTIFISNHIFYCGIFCKYVIIIWKCFHFNYSISGKGVQWDSFIKPPTVDSNFTFGDVILMLWIDSAIYFLITWYIDGVRPGEYGIPQPFYFPFTVWMHLHIDLFRVNFYSTERKEQIKCFLSYYLLIV